MTTHERDIPGEADVTALEGQLAALYAGLPDGQRAVLETILAAGLDRLDTAGDDTGGYSYDVETLFQARKLELQRAWAEADRRGALGPLRDGAGGAGRSPLEPVLAFFRRATAAPVRARPVGESAV